MLSTPERKKLFPWKWKWGLRANPKLKYELSRFRKHLSKLGFRLVIYFSQRLMPVETKKILGEKEVELWAKDPWVFKLIIEMVNYLLTTLINPRNPDLEFKIKELNTQVISLEAALHTYVTYHYLLTKIKAKNVVKSCQDCPYSRNRDSKKGHILSKLKVIRHRVAC